MVRAHVETEDGWRVYWMCGCEPDPEIVAGAARMKEIEYDGEDAG